MWKGHLLQTLFFNVTILATFPGMGFCGVLIHRPGNIVATTSVYEIKPGDTLSEIIFQYLTDHQQRIYGRGNLLEYVIKNNSYITNPDLIFPGKRIYLRLTVNEDNSLDLELVEKSQRSKTISVAEEPQPKDLDAGGSEIINQPMKEITLHDSSVMVATKRSPTKVEQDDKSDDNKKKIMPSKKSVTVLSVVVVEEGQPHIDDTPPPTPKQNDVVDKSRTQTFASLEVLPTISFLTIDAIEKADSSTAKLISKLNYGVDIKFRQHWTPSFSSFLQIGAMQEEYESLSNKILNNSSKTRAYFGLGGKYVLSEYVSVSASVRYIQKSFLRSPNTTQINIEAVALPELNLGLNYKLVDKKPLLLGMSFTAAYLGSASTDNYQISQGTSLGAGLNLTYTLKDSYLYADIFGKQEMQDTSLVKQEKTEVGVGLGLGFHF